MKLGVTGVLAALSSKQLIQFFVATIYGTTNHVTFQHATANTQAQIDSEGE